MLKSKDNSGVLPKVILVILVVIFIITASIFIEEEQKEYKHQKLFSEITNEIENETAGNAKDKSVYNKLHDKNSDFVGFLKIPDTKISYPVMQTVNEPDYYLTHDFNREYSFYGTPYIDYRCKKESSNIIVYGHNINDGRMFGELMEYTSYEFFKKHRRIYFTTQDEESRYEIISVIKCNNDSSWYAFIDAENEKEYGKYLEFALSSSIYDCDVDISNYDGNGQFITLSTCGNDGSSRFLVIGIKYGITSTGKEDYDEEKQIFNVLHQN